MPFCNKLSGTSLLIRNKMLSKKVSRIKKRLHAAGWKTILLKHKQGFLCRIVNNKNLVLRCNLKSKDDERSYFIREQLLDTDSEFARHFHNFIGEDIKDAWIGAFDYVFPNEGVGPISEMCYQMMEDLNANKKESGNKALPEQDETAV